MRICVYGAGAIGGHVAARLAKGGAEVSVVARGAHLRAMQEKGLTVHAFDGVMHCRPRASADPADLGPQDAVIVTVKAPSLPDVAAGIAPLLHAGTSVAFVMNGIPWWFFDKLKGAAPGQTLPMLDPGEAIRRTVGVERTLGGIVYSAATVTEPGVVLAQARDPRVVLGELDGAMTPRLAALAAAIAAGGMGGEAVPDIRRFVWGKLLSNLMTGPLCCLCRSSIRQAMAQPAVHAAALRAGEEVVALAAAYGHDIADAMAARLARAANYDHKPSILQDLELGRAMEVDSLWQAPLELARRAGVPMPTLELSIQLATQAARAAGLYRN